MAQLYKITLTRNVEQPKHRSKFEYDCRCITIQMGELLMPDV